MPPIRTTDGDLVGRTVPYAAGDPATPLEGSTMDGPIRTGDGDLVGRTALYSVSGDVATPITSLLGTGDLGQPGGPAGPLDQNGEIPLSQIPIDGLNFKGAWDASTNTPTLADGTGTAGDLYRVSVAGTQDLGSGSLTFVVGDHLIYEGAVWQQFSPPPALAWGDITGTLADQTDLQAALDAKADDSSLATVATSGDYSDLSGRPIVRDSGTVALHLAGEELLWPTDVTNGKLRLYNSTPASNNDFYGLGVENGAQVYQVDSDTSVHRFQGVDDSDNALTIVELSSQGGIASSVPLHMGEQKIVNVGDPDSARDAANKQYVDGAVAAVSGIATVVTHNTGDSVTLTDTDPEIQLIDAFAASGDFTVTLPGNATTVGKTFSIKKVDGVTMNAVNITPSDGQQIDGSLTAVSLTAQWSLRTLVFDGSNWQVTGAYSP